MAKGRSKEFLRALRKKHHLGEFKLSRGKSRSRKRKDSKKPVKARKRRKKPSMIGEHGMDIIMGFR